MINNNKNVEQLIYTACGKNFTGAFDIWSQSNGLTKEESNYIYKKMFDVFNGSRVNRAGEQIDYQPQFRQVQVLKPGAKPSGFFRKRYKDSDYTTENHLIKTGIKVLAESGTGSLRNQVGYNDDFRANPEKAPYRIVATQLMDGRLMICRVSAIGRVYSELDHRMGNQFNHAYIFPAGTKLSDVNWKNLDFKKGLEPKYWGANPMPAPQNLPTTTLEQINNKTATKTTSANAQKTATNAQKTTTKTQSTSQTKNSQVLSNEQLLDVLQHAVYDKDAKSRIEHKKQFKQQVDLGANILDLQLDLISSYKADLAKGYNPSSIDESLLLELQTMASPHNNLFEKVEKYVELTQALLVAEEENNRAQIENVEKNIEVYKQAVKLELSTMDLQTANTFAKSQKKVIAEESKYNDLKHGKTEDLSKPYLTTTAYKAADLIDRATAKMMSKNIDFDQQNVII